jgi:hypothetical protein
LLLTYQKSRAHAIINLDLEKIDFPNEKDTNVKISRQHTNYEKKFISKILKNINIE